MIYFNKDVNPEVLKTLLDDDSKWEQDYVLRCIGERYKKAVPTYLVRWEAWQVLHGWGHDVPQPDFGIRD